MNKNNEREFAILMGKMSLAFRTEISQAHVALFFEKMEGCSMYQVRRAINEVVETSDHFPYLSKLLTLARSFRREPTPKPRDLVQIEEVATPDGAPTNKEDFFKAMDELLNNKDGIGALPSKHK